MKPADGAVLEFAVKANVASARAKGVSDKALATADERFRASAAAFVAASAGGWSDSDIARAIAAAVEGNRSIPADLQGELYTSSAAVGYHLRTGRLLALAGDSGGMTGREVQRLVRKVAAGEVDRILATAATQAEAIAALKLAGSVKATRPSVADPVATEPTTEPDGQDGAAADGVEGQDDHDATWYLLRVAEQVAEIKSKPIDPQARRLVEAIIRALLPLVQEGAPAA